MGHLSTILLGTLVITASTTTQIVDSVDLELKSTDSFTDPSRVITFDTGSACSLHTRRLIEAHFSATGTWKPVPATSMAAPHCREERAGQRG